MPEFCTGVWFRQRLDMFSKQKNAQKQQKTSVNHENPGKSLDTLR